MNKIFLGPLSKSFFLWSVVGLLLFSFSMNLEGQGLLKESNISIAKPLKVGIVGLVHTHVHWILGREKRGDIEIVGIAEDNEDLARRYCEQYNIPYNKVYASIEEMVEATHPEAVTAFNTIYGHLEVVEYCAPKGIHVMVEKPLAANLDHARRMYELSKKYNIQLLINYETSWYGSNHHALGMIEDGEIGTINRIVFNTGHPGPIEIGCNDEFLEWLTDPILNGGGALTDFGCYGANIATWLFKGEEPNTVSCVTRQFKPELYPKVEDDALIILSYDSSQVIIQASWNWSHNRKDMEVYGKNGYIKCLDKINMEYLSGEIIGPIAFIAPANKPNIDDPFAFLYQVIKGGHQIAAYDLSSIENNMKVMKILHAAKLSSESGRVVNWVDVFKE